MLAAVVTLVGIVRLRELVWVALLRPGIREVHHHLLVHLESRQEALAVLVELVVRGLREPKASTA